MKGKIFISINNVGFDDPEENHFHGKPRLISILDEYFRLTDNLSHWLLITHHFKNPQIHILSDRNEVYDFFDSYEHYSDNNFIANLFEYQTYDEIVGYLITYFELDYRKGYLPKISTN